MALRVATHCVRKIRNPRRQNVVFDSIMNLQLLIQLTELLLYKTYRKYSAKCKMPNKYKNQERSIGRDLI